MMPEAITYYLVLGVVQYLVLGYYAGFRSPGESWIRTIGAMIAYIALWVPINLIATARYLKRLHQAEEQMGDLQNQLQDAMNQMGDPDQ